MLGAAEGDIDSEIAAFDYMDTSWMHADTLVESHLDRATHLTASDVEEEEGEDAADEEEMQDEDDGELQAGVTADD